MNLFTDNDVMSRPAETDLRAINLKIPENGTYTSPLGPDGPEFPCGPRDPFNPF